MAGRRASRPPCQTVTDIDPLRRTFDALRGILQRQKRLIVTVDEPGDYQMASATLRDRTGRPLFLAGVQIRKNYVSYHLIPVYAVPVLLKSVSPGLKARMQGKSCFNFKSVDRKQLAELAALTKAGLAAMKDIDLPWASPD
jgi:hypothetical protein